jgi:hypothetical protein
MARRGGWQPAIPIEPRHRLAVTVPRGCGNVGGYSNFWIDRRSVAVVNGERRSSLITDPPDGKVPATTEEARKRFAERATAIRGKGAYDHPEMRPLAERCLLSFGPTTPMIPNYFYNNNYQIVQTADHVMILMEMVHDARIVRMNATHLPSHIRPWMGDSIGKWEGDTLVIDTTNFPLQQPFRGSAENLHVIERLSRVAPTHSLSSSPRIRQRSRAPGG